MTSSPRIAALPPWPQFDDTERKGLLRALEQGPWWRVDGSEVAEFEREFAAHHGAAAALATTTGTHALELGLEVLGVGPGDEVIVPAFTFASSSLAVQRLGAVPVPVDVDPVTYCIDVDAAADALSPRTRAIMPVHMAGQVADMDRLAALAGSAGAGVLQDAAHAHGARWSGRRMGEFGSVAAFSFQNGKLMTAGEGGALLLPDEATREAAYLRHSCGRPAHDRRYAHLTPGSNYRMNEFSGAVLRAQLRRLDAQVRLREQRWVTLAKLLADIPDVEPQGRGEATDVDPHYMTMFRLTGASAARRDALVDALVERGVPACVTFPAVYRTEGFRAGPAPGTTTDALARRCPVTEDLMRHGAWLHHRVLLASEEAVASVAEAVRDALHGG